MATWKAGIGGNRTQGSFQGSMIGSSSNQPSPRPTAIWAASSKPFRKRCLCHKRSRRKRLGATVALRPNRFHLGPHSRLMERVSAATTFWLPDSPRRTHFCLPDVRMVPCTDFGNVVFLEERGSYVYRFSSSQLCIHGSAVDDYAREQTSPMQASFLRHPVRFSSYSYRSSGFTRSAK